jgi:hypothetical protein
VQWEQASDLNSSTVFDNDQLYTYGTFHHLVFVVINCMLHVSYKQGICSKSCRPDNNLELNVIS